MQRKEAIIESTSYVFIILFLYTGIMKLVDYKAFHFDLVRSPIIEKLEPFLAIAVPVIELIIAVLLYFPKTKKTGLYSSLIIMSLFTLYVGGILAFAKHRPCTCGGIMRSLSWGQHLILNIFLTALAILALYLLRKKDADSDLSSHYEAAL